MKFRGLAHDQYLSHTDGALGRRFHLHACQHGAHLHRKHKVGLQLGLVHARCGKTGLNTALYM